MCLKCLQGTTNMHNEVYNQMFKTWRSFSVKKTFTAFFGFASFFVSPARHGEAQDMSGTWKRKEQ